MPHQRVAVRLVLQDGATYDGFSFGATASVSGELVFSSAMVGYPETLTDPSYAGQMLVCTYPSIGNYGIPSSEARDAHGVSTYFESDRVQVSALIVSEYCFDFSHYTAVKSLSQWLKEHNVPGIYGIDTRALTKRLRFFSSSSSFSFSSLFSSPPSITVLLFSACLSCFSDGICNHVVRLCLRLLIRSCFVSTVPCTHTYKYSQDPRQRYRVGQVGV